MNEGVQIYFRISTHLLARLGWFCPVVSEPVKPYFTRFLRVLTFCLGASKIVIFCENGVVNGVVELNGISRLDGCFFLRKYLKIVNYCRKMLNVLC